MLANNTTEHEFVAKCLDHAFCQRYVGDAFSKTTFFQFVVIVIFAIITPFINGIFIVMMWMLEELRHTSNYFFLNISLVNISFGFASLVTCSMYYYELAACTVQACFYRRVYIHISGTGMALTMTTFTVISIERYICIFYALRWGDIITTRRVVTVLSFLWVFWIAVPAALFVTNLRKVFEMLYMIQAALNITTIVIINSIIFKEIRRHEKRIALDDVASNADETRRAREKRRAKTIILMATLVILGYLPSLVLVIGNFIPNLEQVSWNYAWVVSRTIFLSHTTFDIIVYGLRTDETRKGLRKILSRLVACT